MIVLEIDFSRSAVSAVHLLKVQKRHTWQMFANFLLIVLTARVGVCASHEHQPSQRLATPEATFP